jgi:Ca2+-binding RTX toxin-like protein
MRTRYSILRAVAIGVLGTGLVVGAVPSFADAAETPTCGIPGVLEGPATIVGAGRIEGTSGDDVIVGSAGPDRINGNGGFDLICSLGGNDRITGGPGPATWVFAGPGDDRVEVTGDVALLLGGDGSDRLTGGPGDDLIFGDYSSFLEFDAGAVGEDALSGGGGNDLLVGGAAADRLAGGDGDDQLYGDETRRLRRRRRPARRRGR